MTVALKSVEEALDYIAKLQHGQADDFAVMFDGELKALHINVDGPKYHSSVPAELARGLWEYQEALYRAAAFAITGTDDIRVVVQSDSPLVTADNRT